MNRAAGTRTILVVDDDAGIRESVADVLGQEGYDVRCAKDGEDGLLALRDGMPRPGLILLDLMMPRMNGWEFRQHQIADPALRDIPVVVFTASRPCAEAAFAVGVVAKPMSLEALLEVVERNFRPDQT